MNSLPYDKSSWSILRYFNFEPSFKLRWLRARDLFGSQIPVSTGGFKLRISFIWSSYLTHLAISPNRSGGFTTRLPDLCWDTLTLSQVSNCDGAVQTPLSSLEFVIQINIEHNTITVWNLSRSWSIPIILNFFLLLWRPYTLFEITLITLLFWLFFLSYWLSWNMKIPLGPLQRVH